MLRGSPRRSTRGLQDTSKAQHEALKSFLAVVTGKFLGFLLQEMESQLTQPKLKSSLKWNHQLTSGNSNGYKDTWAGGEAWSYKKADFPAWIDLIIRFKYLRIYSVTDGPCTIPTEKQIENLSLIPSRQKQWWLSRKQPCKIKIGIYFFYWRTEGDHRVKKTLILLKRFSFFIMYLSLIRLLINSALPKQIRCLNPC